MKCKRQDIPVMGVLSFARDNSKIVFTKKRENGECLTYEKRDNGESTCSSYDDNHCGNHRLW